MSERVTRAIEFSAKLIGGSDVEPNAVADVVKVWGRSVNAGFFGTGSVTSDGLAIKDRGVAGRVECNQVLRVALDVLSRTVERPPGT